MSPRIQDAPAAARERTADTMKAIVKPSWNGPVSRLGKNELLRSVDCVAAGNCESTFAGIMLPIGL